MYSVRDGEGTIRKGRWVMQYSVGDAVTVLRPVGDDPSGDSPGGTYARPGDKLIVREIVSDKWRWPIKVSHEHITDRSFGVSEDEIKPYTNMNEKGT